jgi:hypothetical protein
MFGVFQFGHPYLGQGPFSPQEGAILVLDPDTAHMRILMARHTIRETNERNRLRILMARHTVKETDPP